MSSIEVPELPPPPLPLGYCWPLSVTAGETVAVHLAANGPVNVEVLRDGAEPTVVWSRSRVDAQPHSLTDDVPERGCEWPVTSLIETESGWRSGCYLVRVDGGAPIAWFVVRSAQPTPGAALFKLATNTWNAYNDVGGNNLYTGSVQVSFARPLGAGFLSKTEAPGSRLSDTIDAYTVYTLEQACSMWHGMAGWAGQEREFALWAERSGIELDYAIDADLDGPEGRSLLADYPLLISVGHDEYWTWNMRDAIEGYLAEGGNVAYFSGNVCYWQVRIEDDGRTMIAWKHQFEQDPVLGTDREHLTTTIWSDPLLARPENSVTGLSFVRGGYHRIHHNVPAGAGGYEVHRADHWMLEGTGLRRGDLLGTGPGIVGYECDGCELTLVDGLPVPTGADGTPPTFEVVGTAPATPFDAQTTPLPLPSGGEYELVFHARRVLGDDGPAAQDRLRYGHAVLGSWTATAADGHGAGGTVVITGCTDWAFGLDDPTVAQVTRNVLARLGGISS